MSEKTTLDEPVNCLWCDKQEKLLVRWAEKGAGIDGCIIILDFFIKNRMTG